MGQVRQFRCVPYYPQLHSLRKPGAAIALIGMLMLMGTFFFFLVVPLAQ